MWVDKKWTGPSRHLLGSALSTIRICSLALIACCVSDADMAADLGRWPLTTHRAFRSGQFDPRCGCMWVLPLGFLLNPSKLSWHSDPWSDRSLVEFLSSILNTLMLQWTHVAFATPSTPSQQEHEMMSGVLCFNILCAVANGTHTRT